MGDETPAVSPAQVSLDVGQAKAKAIAAYRAGEPAVAPVTPDPVVSKTETVQAKVDIDPESLKAVTEASKKAREWEDKYKAIETETKTLKDAQRLFKEGKRIEAIGLLSGQDSTVAMDELLESYLGDSTPKEPEAKKSPEQVQIDELKKTLADRDAKEKEAELAAKTSHAQNYAAKMISEDDYPISFKSENREEAAQMAIKDAIKLASDRDLNIDELSQADVDELIKEALKTIESDYEARGQRYTKPLKVVSSDGKEQKAAVTTQGKTAPTVTGIEKPGIVIETGRKNLSLEAARERARAAFRASYNQ